MSEVYKASTQLIRSTDQRLREQEYLQQRQRIRRWAEYRAYEVLPGGSTESVSVRLGLRIADAARKALHHQISESEHSRMLTIARESFRDGQEYGFARGYDYCVSAHGL